MRCCNHHSRRDAGSSEPNTRSRCGSADTPSAEVPFNRAKLEPMKTRWPHRLLGSLRWVYPTLALVALPKCPMCLVGYVALVTGTTVSVATAETLRLAVVIASCSCFAWFALRKLRLSPYRGQRRNTLRAYMGEVNPSALPSRFRRR